MVLLFSTILASPSIIDPSPFYQQVAKIQNNNLVSNKGKMAGLAKNAFTWEEYG